MRLGCSLRLRCAVHDEPEEVRLSPHPASADGAGSWWPITSWRSWDSVDLYMRFGVLFRKAVQPLDLSVEDCMDALGLFLAFALCCASWTLMGPNVTGCAFVLCYVVMLFIRRCCLQVSWTPFRFMFYLPCKKLICCRLCCTEHFILSSSGN